LKRGVRAVAADDEVRRRVDRVGGVAGDRERLVDGVRLLVQVEHHHVEIGQADESVRARVAQCKVEGRGRAPRHGEPHVPLGGMAAVRAAALGVAAPTRHRDHQVEGRAVLGADAAVAQLLRARIGAQAAEVVVRVAAAVRAARRVKVELVEEAGRAAAGHRQRGRRRRGRGAREKVAGVGRAHDLDRGAA